MNQVQHPDLLVLAVWFTSRLREVDLPQFENTTLLMILTVLMRNM